MSRISVLCTAKKHHSRNEHLCDSTPKENHLVARQRDRWPLTNLGLAAVGAPGLQFTIADAEAEQPAGAAVSPADVDAVVVGGDAEVGHGGLLLGRRHHPAPASAAAAAEIAGSQKAGRPEELSDHLEIGMKVS